jgi:hypothetical protein
MTLKNLSDEKSNPKKMVTSEKVIYVGGSDRIDYSDIEDLLANMDFEEFDGMTLEEIGKDDHKIWRNIVENLEFSLYYRKMIKEHDVDTLLKKLAEESPSLVKYVDMNILKQTLIELKKDIAEFDILRIPATAWLEIDGKTYHGVDELEKVCSEEKYNVNNICEHVPCFDSNDYAYDNRYFNNFFFCSKSSEKWQKIKQLDSIRYYNHCLVSENMQADILPVINYFDSNDTMMIAGNLERIYSKENGLPIYINK